MNIKCCKKCKIEKNINEYRHQSKVDKIYISCVCKKCDVQNSKNRHLKFRDSHREELRKRSRNYYLNNKKEIKDRQKDKKIIWNYNYYINNKKKIQHIQQKRLSLRYKTDSCFRIRKTVSKAICRTLRLNKGSKNKQSCLIYLDYSIQKLKEHLEKQFKSWMSWNNYGIYNKLKWDDDNQSTWTWQIDHIIPQSDFKYTLMSDSSFKLCWALDNLRPLSAKQNNLDGVNRIRHYDGGKKW